MDAVALTHLPGNGSVVVVIITSRGQPNNCEQLVPPGATGQGKLFYNCDLCMNLCRTIKLCFDSQYQTNRTNGSTAQDLFFFFFKKKEVSQAAFYVINVVFWLRASC